MAARVARAALALLAACSSTRAPPPGRVAVTDEPAAAPACMQADTPLCVAADASAGAPPDRGLSTDRCDPGVALVARVAPARLRADLDALVGLGARSSPERQRLAAAYIRSELRALGVAVSEQSYWRHGSQFVNLEATIAGADEPRALVMAGGHFDSKPGSPGADDNAAGTAALLETARVLATCTPRRTIRLLFFSNEESGRAGSTAYVAELAAQVDPGQVVGYIGMDMVAYPGADGALNLYTRPPYRPLAEAMQAAVERWTDLPTHLFVTDDCG